MKKYFVALLIAFVAFNSNSFAQLSSTKQKKCSSHEYFIQMLQDDPKFAINQQQIEEFTQNYIRNNAPDYLNMAGKTAAPIYTIPVVVHVVYKTTAQNISTSQIQSQIDVLNKDFQKLNSDINKVPSVWTSLAADCQIKFCLATIAPNGTATTGIVRKSTTKTSFSTNNDVKFSNRGGDNAWNSSQYLNIWVCNLSGGTLGYAQFPGGAASTDGVVCHYTAFGTSGAAKYPFNLGRTATHEVGHWLNLRHIWGDDGNGCNGSDLVGDTPNQASERYGCPVYPKVSCSNGPNGDMFMNYMDYVDDRCMYMFTTGQKSRMTALLNSGGSRYSVTVSGKCGASVSRTSRQTDVNTLSVIPNPVLSTIPALTYTLNKAAHIKATIYNMYGIAYATMNLGRQPEGSYKYNPIEFKNLENGYYVIKLYANGELYGSTNFIVSR